MRCPNCGSALSPTQLECTTCGARAPNASAPSSVGAIAQQEYRSEPLPVGQYNIPFGPSEVLSATFRIWSRDWARLMLLAAIPFMIVIPFAVVGGVMWFTMADGGGTPSFGGTIAIGGVAVVGMILVIVASLAGTAGMVALIDENERAGSSSLTVMQALLQGFSKAGRLFVAGLAVGLLATVTFGLAFAPAIAAGVLEKPGLALGLIPGLAIMVVGIYAMLRLSPLWVILVVEDVTIGGAFERSMALTRDKVGTIFVCALLYGLVMFGISLATGIVSLIPILGALIQLAVNLVTMSLGPSWQFSMYAALVGEQQRKS